MPVTSAQAKLLTGIYSYARRSRILETAVGQRLFTRGYFFYKRHLEDPFHAMIQKRPELFKFGHILDVGANIGYTATLFANALAPAFKVFAFEPEAFNFHLLQHVTRSHGVSDRIVPIHSAVGDHEGHIDLWINPNHHADHRIATSALAQNSAATIQVPITSVDAFARARQIQDSIGFIKIDVQGYEPSVCLGMQQTLLSNPQIVVALEYMPTAMRELGFDETKLLEWFSAREYKLYSLSKDGSLTQGISAEEMRRHKYVDLMLSRRALI